MSFQTFLTENYSEKVAKGYIKDYLDFKSFLEEKKLEPEKTTETDIKEYIQFLREKELSNLTISKKISLLRKYFKWMRKNGVMLHNPLDDIQQPKFSKEKTEVSDAEKIEIREKVRETKNIRDQLIFALLMDDSIKPNEMIKITIKDCDLEKRMIYLDKRAVTISEETAANISLIKEVNKEGFLLTNQHGHPLKESGIYFVIKNYLSDVNNTSIKPMHLMNTKKYG